MKTMKQLFANYEQLSEEALQYAAKELNEVGTTRDIRKNVSPEVFALHIAMSVIGNWREDGWWGVFREQPELVPYIADSFETFELQHLKRQFEEVLALFPKDSTFESTDAYYSDILNFLSSPHAHVRNERLRAFSDEEHAELVEQVKYHLKQLEQLTDPLFGDEEDEDRWEVVYQFIEKNRE